MNSDAAAKAIECLLKGHWEQAKHHIKHLTTEKKGKLASVLTFEQRRGLLLLTVKKLVTNQNYGLTVASLFGQSLVQYIYNHIEVVIPYAFQLPTATTESRTIRSTLPVIQLMDAISTTLLTPTQTLYEDFGYLALVHCLLLPPTYTTHDERQAFLNHVFTTVRNYEESYSNNTESIDYIPTKLLRGHITRVISLLSVELWRPDHQHVLDGLNQVKIWSGYETVSLDYYFRTFMLSTLNYINQLLSRSTTSSTKGLHLLSSLIVLMDTIGSEAVNYIPQLLLTAKTITSSNSRIYQDEYGSVYCSLWDRLLSLSSSNTEHQNNRHFNDVIRGMIYAFPLCDQGIKSKMADNLTLAIKSHILEQPATRTTVLTFTDLPPFPEFESLRQWIEEEQNIYEEDMHMQESSQTTHDLKQQRVLKELIVHMSMDEVIPSFDSLQKLHRMLSKEPHIFFTLGNTNEAWPLLGELYDLLLRIIQQYAYRPDICGLAASCLGLLGAIDPSRLSSVEERNDIMVKLKKSQVNKHAMNSSRYRNDMIVLENYNNMSENQAFAIHLIAHYFLPTFYTTTTTGSMYMTDSTNSIQSCSQYAIQEILKAVAITSERLVDRNEAFDYQTSKLWFSLDSTILDVIHPLLHTKFEADVQVFPPDPPLYASAGDSFEDWIQSFYYLLLEKIDAIETVPIFNACIASVKAGHSVLTQHLIPFLILRVLLSSISPNASIETCDTPRNEPNHELILDEIIGVLGNDSFGVNMKQQTLQMVVSITGHCQSWIRQKLQLKKKQLKFTSSLYEEDMEIYTVKTFLSKIPNGLMTKAAFRTGNYPQAMMHFELFLKEANETTRQRHPQPLSNEYLNEICQTYMELEGPETMPEILSKFDPHMTPQIEILRYESSGEWHLAKPVYELLLPTITKEESSQLLGRYFNCLRNLNQYDRIINYSEEMLNNPDLSPLVLQQINTYRAEAAWKSSNWKLLHQCLALPMDDSFEASVARTLAHMQSNNPFAVYQTLSQAKLNEVKRICQKSSGGVAAPSYQKSYDSVLRLQLLQELDSIMVMKENGNQKALAAIKQGHSPIPSPMYDPFLIWKVKFSKGKPSYLSQRQLLDLRMVAQFDIWKTNSSDKMSETEKELRLLLGKTARKAKDMKTAFEAIYRAPLLSDPLALIQLAKWNLERKDVKTCSRYLSDHRVSNLPKARYMTARYKETQYQVMVRKTSNPSRYNDEAEKIAHHYSEVRKSLPNWEKIFYVSGSFIEQPYGLTENDPKYFTRAVEAIHHYCEALKIGSRYYYSTMPRLLSLWLRISEQMQLASSTKTRYKDEMNIAIINAYTSANQIITEYIDQIPPYLFGLALPRLVSRLAINDKEVAGILSKMIVRVLISYPRSTIWSLQYALHSDDHNVSSITANILRQAEALQSNSLVTRVINQTEKFTKHLELLAKNKKLPSSKNMPTGSKSAFQSKFPELLAMENLDICIPRETSMLPSLPESFSSALKTNNSMISGQHCHQPYPTDLPTIVRVLPTIQVMNSLQQPKRLSFLASDGKTYDFLCKYNDELRKDARMMEFSHMINKFLIKNATSRQQQLYIRTYAVIPLGVRWGLIEWINNLNTLKSIVCDRWEAADPIDGPTRLNRLRHLMKTRQENTRCTVEDKVDVLINQVYPQSPVVFASWFLDTFPEPSEWFASRSRYVRTLAVMSIVGYVLGLGDRHAENIMFDATNGDTVHVDVNMLFDHGHDLAIPETVPFRLTRNLIDAMGVTKETGLFRRACMTTLEVLRDHRLQLLSVFETFLFDPMDDRRKRDAALTHEQTARKVIDVINNKIQTKYTVKQNIDILIREASSNLNLAQMFYGWSPFI